MTEGGDRAEEVLVALRRITRAVDLHSRRIIARYGLTVPQFTVLKALEHNTEMSVGDLADAVHLSAPTVTSILDRLTLKGLVERNRSKLDRRRVVVALTERGAEVMANAPSLLHDRFHGAFTRLEVWEQHLMLHALRRIAAMMDAGELDAAPVLSSGDMDHAPPGTPREG